MDTPWTCNPEEMGLVSLSAQKSAHFCCSSPRIFLLLVGATLCAESSRPGEEEKGHFRRKRGFTGHWLPCCLTYGKISETQDQFFHQPAGQGDRAPAPPFLSLCHPRQSQALGDSLQAGRGLRTGESKVSLENHIQPAGRY